MLGSQQNLFASHAYYVNDVYRQRVHELTSASWVDGTSSSTLRRMADLGSAFWIDRIGKISGEGVTLELVFSQAAAAVGPKPLVVAILYDLPNRDCHAMASNGELCCQYAPDGTCVYAAADEGCSDGLDRYRREYVDPFVDVLARYSSVPAAIIIEPDSIPNLATNAEDYKCGHASTRAAYIQGVRYAVEALHRRAPHAALYLDAAHGGWLGWPDKADTYLNLVNQLGDAAQHLRGFATNVANYQALGHPCPASAFRESWPQLGQQYCAHHSSSECCHDPCGLLDQYNSANNEHNYVQLLAARLERSPLRAKLPMPKFVIDTGRNGRYGMRGDCANWCNVRAAGIGHEPTSNTILPQLVDAYYWLKTPGESDGCTSELPDGGRCPRYDGMCGSVDSLGSISGEPRAPEAGEWFVPHVASLVCRAHLDSVSGVGSDAAEDARCRGTESAAVKVTAEVQATISSPPPPPKYEFRRPPPPGVSFTPPDRIDDTPAIMGSIGPVEQQPVDCPTTPTESSSSLPTILIAAMVAFVIWFAFPRFEPRLRQRIGTERYDAYARDAGHAVEWLGVRAEWLAGRAAELLTFVKQQRARMAGPDAGSALPTAEPETERVSMIDALRQQANAPVVAEAEEAETPGPSTTPPMRFGGRMLSREQAEIRVSSGEMDDEL